MRAFALVALVLAAPLSLSSPAHAQPSPPDCDVPCGFTLVGLLSGVPAPQGEFTIIVNDAFGAPIAASEVTLDFTGCVPDINICASQPFPGVAASCLVAPGLIGGITDATGSVTFRIVGGAENTGALGPAAGAQCAAVLANSGPGTAFVPIGTMNVSAYDENGAGGVNIVDLSMWLSDVFTARHEGRSDYNCSGVVNPADLAFLVAVLFSGMTGCGAYCF